jgi:hypothetical protein
MVTIKKTVNGRLKWMMMIGLVLGGTWCFAAGSLLHASGLQALREGGIALQEG